MGTEEEEGGAETGVNLRYTDKTKKSGKKRSKLKEKKVILGLTDSAS